ncbi:MAG: hypothetical protein NTW96_16335 [Planctomycetia bacterium]|nr:hypothetical protein [Planctomycetia bacterium]
MIHALACSLVLLAAGQAADSTPAGEAFFSFVPQAAEAAAWPASVGTRLGDEELKTLPDGKPVTPYAELNVGLRLEDGSLWVGSNGGLMLLGKGDSRWRLFHSRRWLPDDRVLDLAVTAEGEVWVKTPKGTGRLCPRRFTLDEKMDEINRALRKYHLREGFVCEIDLKTPGSVEGGYTQPSSDNDGLWTSLYVAAEAFRYGATGDPKARENAWNSLKTLMFLERVTGIPGFAARSFLPGEGPNPQAVHGGLWYRSGDGRWWWKGDTSSDEIVGHYFAYEVYYRVAATEEQRREIRPYVARITDHIIDHGFYYVGPPGKPTTWGVWAPEKLNHDLQRSWERGLNSLEILSHLNVAEYITGDPRYAAAARELIDRHAYAINTIRQKITFPPEELNHSDDELAFLSYYPLLWHERESGLRDIYMTSLELSFRVERPEQSPLFDLVYAAARQAGKTAVEGRPAAGLVEPADYDRDACLAWFREVPGDTIDWTIDNSRRRDVGPIDPNRFWHARALVVPPIGERLLLRWNADPYQLAAGSGGRTRGDGAFILLPYWLGKYHRLLESR